MSAGHGGDGGAGGGGGGETVLADAERTGGSAPPSGMGDESGEGETALEEHAAPPRSAKVRPKTAGLLMTMEV